LIVQNEITWPGDRGGNLTIYSPSTPNRGSWLLHEAENSTPTVHIGDWSYSEFTRGAIDAYRYSDCPKNPDPDAGTDDAAVSTIAIVGILIGVVVVGCAIAAVICLVRKGNAGQAGDSDEGKREVAGRALTQDSPSLPPGEEAPDYGVRP
jgi:hypothetical protein